MKEPALEKKFSNDDMIFSYERFLRKIARNHSKKLISREAGYTATNASSEIYNGLKKILHYIGLFEEEEDVLFATFRSRRGYKKSALRSIYAKPIGVIKEKDLDDFDFSIKAFELSKGKLAEQEYYDKENEESIYTQYYYLESFFLEADFNKNSFAYRINKFLENIKNKDFINEINDIEGNRGYEISEDLIEDLCKNGVCWVFAKTSKEDDEIENITALYSRSYPMPGMSFVNGQDENDYIKVLGKIMLLTFSVFEDIEQQDRAVFNRQAFEAINYYLPKFVSHKSPPASCVKGLVDQLEKDCKLHPLMGSSDSINNVSIRFIHIEFLERKNLNGNNSILPRQSIYPPVYARDLKKDAMIFSHRHSKTIIKYLLGKWVSSKLIKPYLETDNENGIVINEDFLNTYNEAYERHDSFGRWIYEKRNNGGNLLGLYATSLNKGGDEFWKQHNFLANDDGNKTTAAFFLYNETKSDSKFYDVVDKVPFGVLAFESPEEDAFSKKDIDVFIQISTAISRLLYIADFGMSHIDYSSKLRAAFVKGSFANERMIGECVYELHRLDKSILRKLLIKREHDETWKALDEINSPPVRVLTKTEAEEAFLDILLESPRKWDGQFDNWIRHRIKIYKDKWHINGEQFKLYLDFLEAIPSNSEWHARLSSIPRALINRIIKTPKFESFPAGYSADSIYILTQEEEMRQVLKFSNENDIKKEKSAYQKFVRYSIPLAARMPTDGFAIERDGGGKPGFGVLVSDLVAGRVDAEEPRSFADIISQVLKKKIWGGNDTHEMGIRSCLEALTHNFYENVSRWKNLDRYPFFEHYEKWWNENKQEIDGDIFKVIKNSSRIIEFGNKDTSLYKGPYFIEESKIQGNVLHEEKVVDFFNSLDTLLLNTLMKFQKIQSEIHPELKSFSGNFKTIGKPSNLKNLFEFWEEKLVMFKQPSMLVKDFSAVIHGDLNPQNLTWSSSYHKFQLIDFEHTQFGYMHSDQLKLVFSTLHNAHRIFILSKFETQGLEAVADNFECAINTLYSISSCLFWNDDPSASDRILDEYIYNRNFVNKSKHLDDKISREGNDQSLFLARFIKTVFRTVFIEPPSNNNSIHNLNDITSGYFPLMRKRDHLLYFQGALKSFSLKEISYAFKQLDKSVANLGTDEILRIKYWTDKISNNPDWTISDLLSQVGLNDNEIDGQSNDEYISSLICSYLAYQTICSGLQSEDDA